MSRSLLATLGLLLAVSTIGQAEEKLTLKPLKRMYLMTHALNWLEITPNDPRRKTTTWEQWPGRCEACYQYEQGLKDKYFKLMALADEDAGVFVLPSGMKGDPPLIELAKKTFPGRCVVCDLGDDRKANIRALGSAFGQWLDDDRRRAEKIRGTSLASIEVTVWDRSKAWAVDLKNKLEQNGYTFDPENVEFIAFGEDWSGCAATYPIHIGRALGLKNPIIRRFDLINPDCTQILLKSQPVKQNIEMPEKIQLYIFKSPEGRWLGQYWEGLHGLYDSPHQVTVEFDHGAAQLIDHFGNPRGDIGGKLVMNVGCGGHTPYRADLVQAAEGVSFDAFRNALEIGVVTERKFPKLASVSGTVAMDGEPLADCEVLFYPEGEAGSTGVTDENGRYVLLYNGTHRGAVIGSHVVRMKRVAQNGKPAGPKLPPKYAEDSQLQAEIKDGTNRIDFNLKSN